MIRTAVFSWKCPAPPSRWECQLWTGAVHFAKRHFKQVILVGDEPAKTILIDRLDLPCEFILLQDLPDDLVHIRDLTKLTALQAVIGTGEPAIHIDHDAFLERPLPARILSAPCCGEFIYRPEDSAESKGLFEQVGALNTSLPVPRRTNMSLGLASGFFGGCDTDGIADVINDSMMCAFHSENRDIMRQSIGYQSSVLLGEMAFGNAYPDAAVLLPRGTASRSDYQRAGYTHMAGLKSNPGALALAAMIVRDEFQEAYAKTARRWNPVDMES